MKEHRKPSLAAGENPKKNNNISQVNKFHF